MKINRDLKTNFKNIKAMKRIILSLALISATLVFAQKKEINTEMFDKTNVPNPFQDTLRYGTLDLGELYSRCSKDIGNFGDKKSIAITHCNEYDWDNDKLIELFKDWNIYYSDGETHNDVN